MSKGFAMVQRDNPKRPREYRDPWLTYLVSLTKEGRPTVAVVLAIATIDNMRNHGLEITKELALYLYQQGEFQDRVTRATREAGRQRIQTYKMRKHAERVEKAAGAYVGEWVYFIRWGDRIKIGTAVDVFARCRALSLPEDAVIAVVPGGRKEEHELHVRFAATRIPKSEWFHESEELLQHIESIIGEGA